MSHNRSGTPLPFAAFAIGLIALLTVFIGYGWIENLLLIAGFLGLIAAGLGIVALARKQAPLWAGVTGFSVGAVALAISLILSLQLSFQYGTVPEAGSSGGSAEEIPDESGEYGTAQAWPNNMASGGVLFTEGAVPAESDPLEWGSDPVESAPGAANGDAPVSVTIYVDYRCPHCMIFEQANGPTLDYVLETGQANVHVKPVRFLDSRASETEYSARAATLLACTVSHQPEAAWNIHRALLTPGVQPDQQTPEHDNETLLHIATEANGPLNDEVISCVETGEYMEFVRSINDWNFANPMPGATDEAALSGTPTIIIDGAVIEDISPESLQMALTARGVTFE